MKLISVLITNYNYSAYIEEALDSIRKQNWDNIELLIADDGSTDNSIKIINDWISRNSNYFTKIFFHKSEKNKGKLCMLNNLIELSSGDMIIIWDSDDIMGDSFIEESYNALEKAHKFDKTCVFVYSDCYLINKKNEVINRGYSRPFSKSFIEINSYIPDNGLTYRKALIEVCPLDESIRKGTKHHKWQQIISRGYKGMHINKPLFNYRMHEDNLSNIGNRITSAVEQEKDSEIILSEYWPLKDDISN